MVSNLPVIYCSTLLLFFAIITVSTWYDHVMNLCNANLTNNWNVSVFLPIETFSSYSNNLVLYLSSSTTLSILICISTFDEWAIVNHRT